MSKRAQLSEDQWRDVLEGRAEVIQQMRKLRGKIPANPRCRLCHTPFAGPGGYLFRKVSSINEPWEKNPTLCRRCGRTNGDSPSMLLLPVVWAGARETNRART